MPTIIPIYGAGEQPLVTRTTIWASYGSVAVRAADVPPSPAYGSLGIQGVNYAPALGLMSVNWLMAVAALGSLSTGGTSQAITVPAYSALDTGYTPPDSALGSVETTGERADAGRGSLEVQAPNSFSGSIDYRALISLAIAFESLQSSRASHDDRGVNTAAALSALAANGEILADSRSTLETGAKAGYPAPASLDTGNPVDSPPAKASVDVFEGEGVEFVIDIQDSILASGHGDC